jgi:DNA-binding PadR family transcriptional regulator
MAQVDLLVLSVVSRRPAHGYAIVEALREGSAGAFDLPEGTVYPALYRLERRGLLASRAHVVAGRNRRVYRVTAQGRAALTERTRAWDTFARGVHAILRGAPARA